MGYTEVMKSIGETLAENVRRFRRAKGWTQDELAEHAGLAAPTIHAIENRRRWPGVDTVAQLARGLGLAEAELFVDPEAEKGSGSITDLLRALASLDDSQVRRYLRMITAETSAASSADDVRPSTQALREPGKRAK
jgi:transcriptional regulator with XRE-family HTH domain